MYFSVFRSCCWRNLSQSYSSQILSGSSWSAMRVSYPERAPTAKGFFPPFGITWGNFRPARRKTGSECPKTADLPNLKAGLGRLYRHLGAGQTNRLIQLPHLKGLFQDGLWTGPENSVEKLAGRVTGDDDD